MFRQCWRPCLLVLALVAAAPLGAADDDPLKKTLPAEGKLVDGKPVGDGWAALFEGNELKGWQAESDYWTLKDGTLHGDYKGGAVHHFAYTDKDYADFELHCMVKMSGTDANSGVCIRIKPVNFDNVPGYQVDMGDGYWGCLWDEKREGMVQKYPKELANKLLNKEDWNHYYIIAKGHHIQAWLNGVKTIDIEHEKGFREGRIGFQLCHGKKHTIVDFKQMYIRVAK